MKKISFFTVTALFIIGSAKAQLFISSGSTFFIQPTGVVTVQGDVTGNADIQGGGKVLLKGSANQNVNMNSFTIPNLEIDNTSNATLTGNTRIGSSLLFTNGKILAGNFNLNLADVATVSGMGTSKFVETAGTGQVIKELTANVTSSEIPVGAGTVYRPAFLTTVGTYSSANVGVRVLPVADPSRPVSISDYINAYWPITKTGITGTLNVGAKYDPTDLAGSSLAANLAGYAYAPTDWKSAGETHTPASFLVSVPVTTPYSEVTAIDKFDLVSAKAFLMGPYTGASLMNDNLRTPTNYIPTGDPYRLAAYSANFPHFNNPITESAAGAVFADQVPSTNNIVDWVFLELRDNTTPTGNQVLQTRSALLRKDGLIVDVDGVSPVTFNKIASGNYTLAVRHRNHLGISTDPVTFQHALSDVKSAVALIDFTTATDAQIYGNSSAFALNAGKVLLWSGDVSGNKIIKYTGSNNDPSVVLTQVLAFPANSGGAYNFNGALGYFSGDVNMDSKVKYTGSTNDPSFILTNVLNYPAGNTAYNFAAFASQLPN